VNNSRRIKNNYIRRLKLAYCIASVTAFLCGMAIYAFFRNINNMIIFRIINKPSFFSLLYIPIRDKSIWVNMFIYNFPYGLWCLSGLLLVRAVWLTDVKWRVFYGAVFMAVVTTYVILKLPKIVPGTFDIFDILFMGFFAFVESLIYNMFIKRSIAL